MPIHEATITAEVDGVTLVTWQPDEPVPPPDHPSWDRFSVWRFSAMDDDLADGSEAATASSDAAGAVPAAGARSAGQPTKDVR